MAAAQSITPQPIPSGYNFPTAAATIQGWIRSGNTTAMRQHAWDIWGGLNAPSGQTYNGQNLPVWETWLGTEVSASLQAAALGTPSRRFQKPTQFHHRARRVGAKAQGNAAADGQLVSFNKFSPAEVTAITTPQTGPGGITYQDNQLPRLLALNAVWPANTPVTNRAIPDLPIESVELKPVLGMVKAVGLTAMLLWQGPAAATNHTNPTPNTWTTCLIISPLGSEPVRPASAAEKTAVAKQVQAQKLSCRTYAFGTLSTFYAFKMNAQEAADFNKAQGGGAAAGDFAVLLAMHVNSKEIPNWTWQTFRWQPGGDTPHNFPGSKAGQPATLPAPFNNYAMCAAYSQTQEPQHGPTPVMNVCFNPYLETSPGIPAGITSNCVSCHGVAVVTSNAKQGTYPANYKVPVLFFTAPIYYSSCTTRTDFSWAIADGNPNVTPPTPPPCTPAK